MTARDGPKAAIYQTGTITSLVNAVYDGDRDIAWIKTQGDFGLGTFEMVDGELIVCDGTFYRADANGDISVADDGELLPFAVVSHFDPDQSFDLINMSYAETIDYLEDYFVSKNLIYTVRIVGQFDSMQMRSEKCQPDTYRPMNETLPELQRVFRHDDIEGTLVGVWFPDYLSKVNVNGFHFHFVDEERKVGGHVFDFELARARVSIQTIKSLQLDLIDNNEFAQADLNSDITDALNEVEQQDD